MFLKYRRVQVRVMLLVILLLDPVPIFVFGTSVYFPLDDLFHFHFHSYYFHLLTHFNHSASATLKLLNKIHIRCTSFAVTPIKSPVWVHYVLDFLSPPQMFKPQLSWFKPPLTFGSQTVNEDIDHGVSANELTSPRTHRGSSSQTARSSPPKAFRQSFI